MLENEYRFNKGFHDFVDKYCAEKNITVDEALEHEKVRRAFLQYTEV